ncbi:MAG: bifunctional diguanylate cyclase/phosphodiesterase [Acidimicrobiales bacterium]|nr:bifunctional diguanylate cyclase/phosphodiesterase [Acidimicrobiales bacterium]
MNQAMPPGSPGAKGAGGVGGVLSRLKRSGPEPSTEEQVELDAVTGLPTRRYLASWADRAVRRSHSTSTRAVVAFVGVGLLRDVNDSFGADVGDRLLHEIGARLQTIDLPGTRVVRYGGAEFGLVFERLNNISALEQIAEFLVELVGRPFLIGSDEITVRPVVGAAISADNYQTVDELIIDAHQALARARDTGSPWEVHDESKRGRYATRLDEGRLLKALDDHEFALLYQPIVRLDNHKIVGFEALVRLLAPGATNVGYLSPGDFMPMLEKSGMSVRLGEWVFDEACRQLAAWRQFKPAGTPLFMTCNVSGRQLASDTFADAVDRAIRNHGIAAGQLCLDITESSLRFTGADAWPVLRELTDRGVKIGLDDFGTGMSSLQYLLEFNLDYVRIDRGFVDKVSVEGELGKAASSIVRHIAAMASELGILAIAEGVETTEQASLLSSLGALLGQGFAFGRPERADHILTLLDPQRRAGEDRWSPSQVLEGGDAI